MSPIFATLDLGTNNCRLMIASYKKGHFRILETYSRIVRLGEGLESLGALSPQSMTRALSALKQCAARLKRYPIKGFRAVATAACRKAENGQAFIKMVKARTGIALEIIAEDTEAQLAVAGCASLIEPSSNAVLIVDVGGGSTELSWIDVAQNFRLPTQKAHPIDPFSTSHRIVPGHSMGHKASAWLSIDRGVVTLSEFYHLNDADDLKSRFADMVTEIEGRIRAFQGANDFKPLFLNDQAYIIGTSGAITSLAGLHLNLPRYDRNQVDGLWMDRDQCEAVIHEILSMSPSERMAHPCIGKDRADLVIAGAAILQAIMNQWPCQRLRVADRGLREGLLMSLVNKKTRRRRKSKSKGRPHLIGTVESLV